MFRLLSFRARTCPLHSGFLLLISLEVNLAWKRPLGSLLCLSPTFAKAKLVGCPMDLGAGGGGTAPPDSVLPLHMGTCTSVAITHMSHCGPWECSPLRLYLSPFSYPTSPSASSAGMNGFSYLLSHIKIPFLMNCPFPSAQPGLPLCSAPTTPLGSSTLQHLPKKTILVVLAAPTQGVKLKAESSADPLGSLEAPFLSKLLVFPS